MDSIVSILHAIGLIAVVVALFNVIIFVHELGHFLAARWRGFQVDRFQIWFGKPIWKKEINGVQYGLGWIPAGGFVALPQMAPMESVEGGNRENEDPLPPAKPIDKIIVAFAGPLFSFLLALTAGLIVSKVGKPEDFVATTEIGWVQADSPAEKAGLAVGDKILEINGEEVNGFYGTLDSVQENIMLSEGDKIQFLVERPGEAAPIALESQFEISGSPWYRRKGMRQVGIWVPNKTVVGPVSAGGPADQAGLKTDDIILAVDGEELICQRRFFGIVAGAAGKTLQFDIQRGDEKLSMAVTPVVPLNSKDQSAKIGIGFGSSGEANEELVYPSPFKQVGDSLRMMWVTIAKVASPKSSVGPEHLAGPVGIGKAMFDLLTTENGWRRLIWFLVLFNVNLAVLNMLPLPVLDGGHIVMALGEMLFGRPVKAGILEVVQTGFALVLLCFFLFITSKDIGDNFFWGKPEPPVWPGASPEAQG
jgi:regulator of sigma E protease